MKHLRTGQFYGQTNNTLRLKGITLTDTEYTQDKVDWHYHENAYFTFLLQGSIIEVNKKETHYCSPGTLLFHNWQEPHHNIKPKGFTRGFHIELEQKWFTDFTFTSNNLQGSFLIENPDIKLLMYKIFKETKVKDTLTSLSIETLILQALAKTIDKTTPSLKGIPAWVNIIKDVLHTSFYTNHSLENLATTAGIHPVHLSRYFPKYFYCSIGEYIRKLRIEKSLSLLPNKKTSLTEIAFECGFSDQSHFTRCFKEINGLTPSGYRKFFFD